MIVWDAETMSTGLALIDAQHRMLFDKFNELSGRISEGGAASREAAGEILDFLQFYAVWHFSREEDCMNQYKCPVAAENKQAHKEFTKKFSKFYEQWQSGDMTTQLVTATYVALEEWLLRHVARTDSQLRTCVKK